jgi:hypothetical protein
VTAKDIPPGGVGEVKATFESKGYQGEVKKTITVESNDPENPTLRLTLNGTVVAEVTINPRYLNFGFIKKYQPVKPLSLAVSLREGKGLKVTDIRSESPMIVIKKQKETQQEVVYEVSLVDKVPIGSVNGMITVTTNSKRSPKIQIPFHGIIQGNVKVMPQIVSFGGMVPGQKATQTLYLTQDGDKEFTIKEIKTTSKQLTTEITPVKQGSKYEVKVTYDPGDQKEGRISERISIVVNDPDENIMEVPVYGMIAQQTAPKIKLNRD